MTSLLPGNSLELSLVVEIGGDGDDEIDTASVSGNSDDGPQGKDTNREDMTT